MKSYERMRDRIRKTWSLILISDPLQLSAEEEKKKIRRGEVKGGRVWTNDTSRTSARCKEPIKAGIRLFCHPSQL